MPGIPTVTRRDFIGLVSASIASSAMSYGQEPRKKQLELIGFIKSFQKLDFERIAEISAEIGWDGIECPVRKGGTIEPAAVEEELPKLVESLRRKNLSVPVIATDIDDASDPLTARVLRTAGRLGISRYRMKHLYYDLKKPIAPQLENFRPKLRDLAQLNGELHVQGTIQNHSGQTYVGAPVWDMWELIRTLDPRQMAVYFDIGHATLEGGLSWPLQAKLVEPILSVVSVKDFKWVKDEPSARNKNGWRDEWCPLGEGMVQPEFFDALRKANFQGPISTHYEYEIGSGKEMIAAMKQDMAVLKRWLSESA